MLKLARLTVMMGRGRLRKRTPETGFNTWILQGKSCYLYHFLFCSMLARLTVMMGRGRLTKRTPEMAHKPPITFPKPVTGEMSP